MNSLEILERTLKKLSGRYYIEKIPKTRILMVHFWEMYDLEKGLERIKKAKGEFYNYVVQDNREINRAKL